MLSREHAPAPHGPPTVERVVRAAKFGEGLLEQHRPQLLAVALHVLGPRRPLAARDAVVDGDDLPRLLLGVEEADVILAARVGLQRVERVPDRRRVLCRARQRRDEPAVAHRPLAEVGRLDAALIEHRLDALVALLLG